MDVHSCHMSVKFLSKIAKIFGGTVAISNMYSIKICYKRKIEKEAVIMEGS